MNTRRQFLATSATAALALGTRTFAEPPAAPKTPIKLGISSYSYWHFTPEKTPIETVISKAAALGVEGVDILHRQMDCDELGPLDGVVHAYCQRLKRHAFQPLAVRMHRRIERPEFVAIHLPVQNIHALHAERRGLADDRLDGRLLLREMPVRIRRDAELDRRLRGGSGRFGESACAEREGRGGGGGEKLAAGVHGCGCKFQKRVLKIHSVNLAKFR